MTSTDHIDYLCKTACLGTNEEYRRAFRKSLEILVEIAISEVLLADPDQIDRIMRGTKH